jgi:hypothetical protein
MRLEALTVHILEQQLAESNIPSANLITIEIPNSPQNQAGARADWKRYGAIPCHDTVPLSRTYV